MKLMRSFFLVSYVFVMSGCVSTTVIKEDSTLDSLAENIKGRNGTLYILNNPLACVFKEMNNGELVLTVDSSEIAVPGECITQIRVDSGGRGKKGMVIGGLAGGAVGFTAGWFAAREASTSDINALGHPATLGMFVGSAGIGAILGAGSKTVRQYYFSSTAKSYILHDEVGEDITPAEIKLFSVFDDLKQEGEQLLLVRIIQYGENKFLLLYESVKQGEYVTDLKKIDENYLSIQKEKINKVLSSNQK